MVLASGLNVALGAWLMASPWVLGFADRDPVWICVVAGLLIATLGYIRAAAVRSASKLSWTNVVLGAWTFSTALWLYDDPAATSNAAVVGIVVVMLAFLSASATDATREAQRK